MTPQWSDAMKFSIEWGSAVSEEILAGVVSRESFRLDDRHARAIGIRAGCFFVESFYEPEHDGISMVNLRRLSFDDVKARCLWCGIIGTIDVGRRSSFFADHDGAVVCRSCDNARRDGTDVVPHRG